MSASSDNETNPYSAPIEVRSDTRDPYWDDEGGLVVPLKVSEVTLPPICWVTGQTVDLASRKQTLRTSRSSGQVFMLCAGVMGPVLGYAARWTGYRELSNLGLLFWYVGVVAYFVLMKRVSATLFEHTTIRESWHRIRVSTYAGFGGVLLLALLGSYAFGIRGAIVATVVGSVAMVILAKFRLRNRTLQTKMRSGCIVVQGFSEAFHTARLQLEREGQPTTAAFRSGR